jgi:hypothetical protein
MRDVSLNLAMWCFSFRYWNISHVLPMNLRGKQISTFYKVVSISLFLSLSLVNVIFPLLFAFYLVKVYSMNGHTEQEMIDIWNSW